MKKASVIGLFFLAVFSASASEWYRSNPGGLALERMARLAALRQDYALEVTDLEIEDLPRSLQSMGIETNRIIGEVLYHEKKVILRRYKLYDVQNRLMAASQFADQGYSWIEQYDRKGRLIEEYWSIDSSSWLRRVFTFNKELIVASKTYDGSPGSEGTLLYTDTYRYDRSGFLRTIERIPAEDAAASGNLEWFSRNALSLASQNRPGPGTSGTPRVTGAADAQLAAVRDVSITYSLDSKGRVIREQHRKEDGTVLYERTNTWDGDRLSSAQITEEGKTTTIEYSYDAQGNRIGERYYSGSLLERQITIEGNQEIEELYDNGTCILRTVWVDGEKKSEQRPQGSKIKP